MAIRFFVDSGSDLPTSLARDLGIVVVPLTIHFGDRAYKDGVELSPSDFYHELESSVVPPNTSQPSPGEFLAAYQEHTEPGDTVFSFHLSSQMSGTYQSAVLAARQLPDRDMHVIDTRQASLGIALPAILGARWAAMGASVEEIRAKTQALLAKVRVYFMVDTLEYLQRHGRIGRAQALVGGLLNIKPVLSITDGVVSPVERVRGKKQALARVCELVLSHVREGESYVSAVLDAKEPEAAASIAASVQSHCPGIEVFRATLGATIGTHAGPGTVGVYLASLP